MSDERKTIRRGEPAPPNAFVIFGATGDLTKRKLIPALYNLRAQKLLRDEFAIIAVARKPISDEELREQWRAEFREFATGPVDDDMWKWIEERCYAHCGTFVEISFRGGVDAGGVVGACHRSECKFNDKLECTAASVKIGAGADVADCLTYDAREGWSMIFEDISGTCSNSSRVVEVLESR